MTVRATGWRRGQARRAERRIAAALLTPLRHAVERTLTIAVQQLAETRPDVFDRLGGAQWAVYLICPDGMPFAFRLEPLGRRALVRIVAADHSSWNTRISGPLPALLALLEGRLDADSAFFSRVVRVEGDTAAMTALHNAIEAAELELPDLLPMASPARRIVVEAWRAMKARAILPRGGRKAA